VESRCAAGARRRRLPSYRASSASMVARKSLLRSACRVRSSEFGRDKPAAPTMHRLITAANRTASVVSLLEALCPEGVGHQ
jgi:hypothetical protein